MCDIRSICAQNITLFQVCECNANVTKTFFSLRITLQARGPKKHLKRLNAPKAWMLDKLGGVFAPRPSTGPHKLRESLPLVIFLRNRLKYALVSVPSNLTLLNIFTHVFNGILLLTSRQTLK